MSGTEALEYFKQAQKLVGIQFNPNDYLKDAEQAVCLLVEDGMMITFTHRSFQEYFAAKFIFNSKPEVQEKLINKYSRSIHADSVMQLLYEMNPELVERTLVIPRLEKLEQLVQVKNKVGITHYLRFLKNELSMIGIYEDGRLRYHIGHRQEVYAPIIRFAVYNCGHLAGIREPRMARLPRRDKTLWDTYKNHTAGRIDSRGGLVFVPTSKLKGRDPLVEFMMESNGSFSRRRLEAAFLTKNALIKKHQELDNSLDNILDI
jgi:hypothetical protein